MANRRSAHALFSRIFAMPALAKPLIEVSFIIIKERQYKYQTISRGSDKLAERFGKYIVPFLTAHGAFIKHAHQLLK